MLARLIITYICSLVDLILTLRLVNKYGVDIEGNPIGRWLLEKPIRATIFKVVIVGIACAVLFIFKDSIASIIASWVCLVAYVALTIYHIVIIIKFK